MMQTSLLKGSFLNLVSLCGSAKIDICRNYEIHFGKIASGDEDIFERSGAEELHNHTNALAVAWEGAGGARATRFMGIPYLEIRGLTDVADNEAPVIFDENLKVIMPRIALVVASLQSMSPN
jgi:nucleoside phosphorylase